MRDMYQGILEVFVDAQRLAPDLCPTDRNRAVQAACKRDYYLANRDVVKARSKAWTAANKASVAASKRLAYRNNPGPARARARAWNAANRERRNELKRLARAKL